MVGGGARIKDKNEGRLGGAPPSIPRLDPQHPQQLGKYGAKSRSDPQQSRNKGATLPQQPRVAKLLGSDMSIAVNGHRSTSKLRRSGM